VYVNCSCGRRHWGQRGAAGLLLTDPERTGLVLQLRSARVHQGNSWGLMGGAIERGEDPAKAALREAHEEAGVEEAGVSVLRTVPGLQHPEWTYTYVLAETPRPDVPDLPGGLTWEADRTTWVDLDEAAGLPLHPVLRQDWPWLHDLLAARG
jgi:8-oxo-dGTP diphosphatase